jgi:hypothetical protein
MEYLKVQLTCTTLNVHPTGTGKHSLQVRLTSTTLHLQVHVTSSRYAPTHRKITYVHTCHPTNTLAVFEVTTNMLYSVGDTNNADRAYFLENEGVKGIYLLTFVSRGNEKSIRN